MAKGYRQELVLILRIHSAPGCLTRSDRTFHCSAANGFEDPEHPSHVYRLKLSLLEMHLTALKEDLSILKEPFTWVWCHDTRRSTFGSAQFLGHRLVSGHPKSRKVLPSPLQRLNTSPYQDAVLKSSGCVLNFETMDLRSTKFQCIMTIKVLLLYAAIVFNTRASSTLIYVTTLSKSRTQRFCQCKDPEPPSVPPTKKQVDDLFQWFDDDEVVPIPPVVPITPVNVLLPQAQRMP
ncbi:hypothetical protein Tco_0174414 [Tanacetum coccineum]